MNTDQKKCNIISLLLTLALILTISPGEKEQQIARSGLRLIARSAPVTGRSDVESVSAQEPSVPSRQRTLQRPRTGALRKPVSAGGSGRERAF